MKKKIISLLSALTVGSGLAPVALSSCGHDAVKYDVTITEESGKSIDISPKEAIEGRNYNPTIEWQDKTNWMIDTCTIEIGEQPIKPEKYELNKITGELSIPAELIKGKIDIVVKLKSTAVTLNTTDDSIDCTFENDPTNPEFAPHYGQSYSNTITGVDDWSIVTGFNIYISKDAQEPLKRGVDYDWNTKTHTFTIFEGKITDDIYLHIPYEGTILTIERSEKLHYVEVNADSKRVAEYRIDYTAPEIKNGDVSVEATILHQYDPSIEGKKISILSCVFDDTDDQIVVSIIPNADGGEDKDLYEIIFDLKVSITDSGTSHSQTFGSLVFENVIVNTPDMLKYDESKTIVTGPNDTDARWDTCDALLIPKNVVEIGKKAFAGYGQSWKTSNLHWLILDETWNKKLDPEGCKLKTIGEMAFQGVPCLRNGLYIPATVEALEKCAFSANGDQDEPFELFFVKDKDTGKAAIKTIGPSAFNRCALIGTINIPSTVETIGSNAFVNAKYTSLIFETNADGTSKLNEIGSEDPAGVDPKKGSAFAGATELEGSIIIPNGVKTIRLESFYCAKGNTGVTSVLIPNTVTTIEDSVFKNFKGLSTIDLSTWTECPTWSGLDIFRDCASSGKVIVNNSKIGESILNYLIGIGLPKVGWTFEVKK